VILMGLTVYRTDEIWMTYTQTKCEYESVNNVTIGEAMSK